MLLEEIIARIPDARFAGDPRVPITGITCDSRTVRSGSLFVAIKGEKTHGAQFLDEAMQRGAAAIAAERELSAHPGISVLKVPDARRFLAQASVTFYRDPTDELKLVAITGTNGKTTTSYLLDSIFHEAGIRSCVVGTIGLKIAGVPYPTSHTTPEAPDLMAFLRKAADAGCTHGAIEVSSHALVLKRAFGAHFAAAIFTNLTPDHLDFHKDMESYYHAKRLLFIPEGGNRLDWAVVNVDDPYGRRLAAEVSCPLVRYGLATDAEIRALEFQSRVDETDLRIALPKGELHLRTRLVGRPNIYNTLAAAAAAVYLGIEPEFIRRGIEALEGVSGRMELVDAGQRFTVVVDYAHTPDALENLLQTVAALPHRAVITVFGCGGDRDRFKRPVMGEIAVRMSDLTIATSDNPRSEDPVAILREIETGLRKGPHRYEVVPDRRAAIRSALSSAKAGDIVVIAGKGHEDRQIIGTQALPFDDREVVREIILESRKAAGGGDL